MDTLTVQRSQPVQGHDVAVKWVWNERTVGTGVMPFTAWLKFNKLLQKGMELDARENHGLQLRLKITGIAGITNVDPTQQPLGSVSLLAQLEQEAEAEGDEDLKAVIEAEKAQATPVEDELVRSLRGESDED